MDKVDFLYSDCLDMDIKTESVDIVLSNQVIDSKYEKYLLEIERILKSNGFNHINSKLSQSQKHFIKIIFQRPIMRWENNQNLPLNKYRGHVKEFFEDELIALI